MPLTEILEALVELGGAIRDGRCVFQVGQQLDSAVITLRRSLRDPRRGLLPDAGVAYSFTRLVRHAEHL